MIRFVLRLVISQNGFSDVLRTAMRVLRSNNFARRIQSYPWVFVRKNRYVKIGGSMPPTVFFTSAKAESVRLSMPPRQRRESFQLLPQARLAFGADETRTLIARHRLFSVIFSLFVLAGVSPPASQKEKIPRKFLCGGCVQFSRCGFLS